MKTALITTLLAVFVLSACASKHPYLPEATGQMRYSDKYKIAPGDSLEIFVWRYPEVSTTVEVRSDGFITANLLEDMPAAGKTPTELARDLERELSLYLRDPLVSVIVGGGVGIFQEQIRVIGEATTPSALLYTDGMTLLDLLIKVGGITEFADGNNTVLIRVEEGVQKQYTVRAEDLVRGGDITANVDMRPGDIVIIPESWF
jgi:polysaccharide export outer membrane protein